ncbi:unnamed protein product [Heligmosomoides polygyrus]|uniref:Uncharacterized protein n=1 Tax=Heligmosomoides polygyrus TaxID=6339 RepID=A0A183F6L8_HELPZ|nr:unnamed protein product [Heligmosomoides polygyrus]
MSTSRNQTRPTTAANESSNTASPTTTTFESQHPPMPTNADGNIRKRHVSETQPATHNASKRSVSKQRSLRTTQEEPAVPSSHVSIWKDFCSGGSALFKNAQSQLKALKRRTLQLPTTPTTSNFCEGSKLCKNLFVTITSSSKIELTKPRRWIFPLYT